MHKQHLTAKKAQVTMFVVLGMVLLVLAAVLFYINYGGGQLSQQLVPASRIPELAAPIKASIDSCLEQTAINAIIYTSSQGGYFELPKYSVKSGFSGAPYYLYENKQIMPSISKIENEISSYINEELPFCMENFIAFRKNGFEIEAGKAATRTEISLEGISFGLKFPVKIKKGDFAFSLDSFGHAIKGTRLNEIYEVSKTLSSGMIKNSEDICFSCILAVVSEHDFRIEINRLDQNIFLYTIIDNFSTAGETLKFSFAHKYR